MSDNSSATISAMRNISKQFGCYDNDNILKKYNLSDIGREWNYATGHFETTQKQTQRILDFQRTGQ